MTLFFEITASWVHGTFHPLEPILARSPTVDLVGSYFPAWLICIAAGLLATLILRLLLIGAGIDPHLRPKPLVYPCVLVCCALSIWLLLYGS